MAEMVKEYEFFVHTNAVDCNDVIKPYVILDYFQDIAAIHADELGVGYDFMKERNLAWVILYQHFEIMNLPPYLENVNVITWPKPNRRLEFEREYLITDKNNNVCVKGISNWVVIDMENRGLVRTEQIKFNGEYRSFTNYEEKCKRKLNLDKENIEKYFEYRVSYADLDHNGHMNNSKYLNIVFDLLPLYGTKKFIKNVEIAFVKEARYNDVIKIGYYRCSNNEEAYIGFVNEEVCFECLIGVDEK